LQEKRGEAALISLEGREEETKGFQKRGRGEGESPPSPLLKREEKEKGKSPPSLFRCTDPRKEEKEAVPRTKGKGGERRENRGVSLIWGKGKKGGRKVEIYVEAPGAQKANEEEEARREAASPSFLEGKGGKARMFLHGRVENAFAEERGKEIPLFSWEGRRGVGFGPDRFRRGRKRRNERTFCFLYPKGKKKRGKSLPNEEEGSDVVRLSLGEGGKRKEGSRGGKLSLFYAWKGKRKKRGEVCDYLPIKKGDHSCPTRKSGRRRKEGGGG